MEKKLKKLPAGIQTFEDIISKGYIYVDKTPMLIHLIENGKLYFFSRPRRFGKSVMLTTLEALFQGRKELFRGLYAEQWLNRPEFEPQPVIRLSMNKVTSDSGIEVLKESICKILHDEAWKNDFALSDSKIPGDLFRELIIKMYTKHNRQIVVLIDEYDKLYIDHVDNHEMAEKVREVLANFYVQIKGNDELLSFALLTGISKFAKMGVFSKLNTLTDISLRDEYAALCGITKDELLANFDDYIDITAEAMNITKDELVQKMEDEYDGFSFNGKVRLYNPYSTLRFFGDKRFLNYWFDSATSTMVAKYLKDKTLTVEQFRGMPVLENFVFNPGEMDNTPPQGFLYQSGFLTLRESTLSDYALDYPNKEVLDAMSRLVSESLMTQNNADYSRCNTDALISLYTKDYAGLVAALNRLLASIPYDDFKSEADINVKINDYTYSPKEWFYRAMILTFFRGCGLPVFAEMHTNKGRADIIINHKGQIWIIELKVAYKGDSPAVKAEEAYNQIFEKNYDKPYPNSICLGMAIDDEQRQITKFIPEK